MLAEPRERLNRILRVPNKKFVVVSSGCKLLLVEGPLQSADLLTVANQLSFKITMCAQVAVQDTFVSAACAQKVACPAHGANTSIMAT
jgi:hypothetical protein